MSALIDLTGREFGGLRVLGRGPAHASRQAAWICRCSGCGREVEALSQNLRLGRVRSCGGPACRGRWPLPNPATAITGRPQAGAVGTVAALLRASVDDDHTLIADLVAGLDEDDDPTMVLLQLLRVGTVALVKAEGSTAAAHRVVDSLAAWDRADGP